MIKHLVTVAALCAALHNAQAQPQLRTTTMQVVCGNAQEILTDLSKSPYEAFILATEGEIATIVFVDPNDNDMLVFRVQGATSCAVAGGTIKKRNNGIFREAKNAVGN